MLLSFALLGAAAAQELISAFPLIATTNVGTFEGFYSSPNSVRAWLGIPFAKSTNGTRRFRPPQRADVLPASTVFNASSFGPACPSFGSGGNATATTSEDCLSINIWSPSTNRLNSSGTPVLIWIYGGGYFAGSSSMSVYNGNNFVRDQSNITVVSFNYRISALGFPAGSGLSQLNPGFLDQRMAVEWVYNNIRAFGGDPTRITLFGESAGAASVGLWPFAYQYDPIVKGLIMESGTEYLNTFISAPAGNASTALWQQLATAVGCSASTTNGQESQVACIQNAPLANFSAALTSVPGGTRFLPTPDDRLLFNISEYNRRNEAGDFASIPTLLGTNNNEGTSLVSIYGGGVSSIADTITNSSFTCPASKTAFSKHNQTTIAASPVWQYRYFGTWPNITPQNSSLGAFHSAEIPLVFGTYTNATAGPAQRQTSQIMQSAWVAFAHDPVSGLNNFGWPQYNETGNTLIEIAKNYYNVSTAAYSNTTLLPLITFNQSQTYNEACDNLGFTI